MPQRGRKPTARILLEDILCKADRNPAKRGGSDEAAPQEVPAELIREVLTIAHEIATKPARLLKEIEA